MEELDRLKPIRSKGRRAVAVAVLAIAAMTVAACSSSKESTGSGGTTKGSGSTAGSTATGTPYVVGSIVSMTGSSSSQWADSAPELQAWASWTNAHGGINGHPVQLKIEDDKSTPSAGLQAAKKLINEKVFALIGGGSSTASAWATAIQEAGIPVIGGAPAGGPPWGSNPLFYPTSTSGMASTYLLAKGAVERGVTKIGVAYCAEAATCSAILPLVKGSTTAAGGTLVNSQAVSISAPSYAAPCLSLKASGAEAVLPVLPVATLYSFVKQCAQQGFKPVWFPPEITPEWATDPLLTSFVGVIENFPWFADLAVAKDYRDAMTQYFPKGLTENLTLGPIVWSSGLLFQKIAANLGDAPTSAAAVAALNQVSNETLGGATAPLTFTDGNRLVACGFLVGSTDGKFTLPNGTTPVCAPPASK